MRNIRRRLAHSFDAQIGLAAMSPPQNPLHISCAPRAALGWLVGDPAGPYLVPGSGWYSATWGRCGFSASKKTTIQNRSIAVHWSSRTSCQCNKGKNCKHFPSLARTTSKRCRLRCTVGRHLGSARCEPRTAPRSNVAGPVKTKPCPPFALTFFTTLSLCPRKKKDYVCHVLSILVGA